MAPQKRRCIGDSSSRVAVQDFRVETVRNRLLAERYGDDRTEDKGVPRACECGHVVVVETETEALNKGKQYFSCPYGAERGCGFKRWWTRAIVEEFEVIKSGTCKMQRSLAEANEKHEDVEERVSVMEDDGTMEHTVKETKRKLGELNNRHEELEERVCAVEDDGTMDHDLEEANRKIAALSEKYEELAAKYALLESKFEKLNNYL